jgi:hypothetical protein
MYMLIVAVFVVPFLLLALVFGSTSGFGGSGSVGGIIAFGLLAIFGYGFFGWVFTAIAVAVYNLAAGWVGGIEVQIEAVAPPPPVPAWNAGPPAGPLPTSTPPPPSAPPPPADPGTPPPTV